MLMHDESRTDLCNRRGRDRDNASIGDCDSDGGSDDSLRALAHGVVDELVIGFIGPRELDHVWVEGDVASSGVSRVLGGVGEDVGKERLDGPREEEIRTNLGGKLVNPVLEEDVKGGSRATEM